MPECLICKVSESVMHRHHTTPRCRGGENSPQVDLCSSCHNILHSNAKHLVSCIKGNRKPSKTFWRDADEEIAAQPLVQLIVKAFITEPLGDPNLEHPLTFNVPTSVLRDLKKLQSDLGASSMEKTLVYCVSYVLKSRGIKNAKATLPMWHLPVSQQGKDF